LGGSGAVAYDRRMNPAKVILPEFIRYHIDIEAEHKGVAYYLVGAVISKTDSVGGDKCTCRVRINREDILFLFISDSANDNTM